MSELRHAFRSMMRAPAFTATAVLSLALAIGAATSVFSLLNAVALRELAVRDPRQLVAIENERPGESQLALMFPAFEMIAARQQVFSSLIAYWGDGIFNVEANGVLVRGDVWTVTSNFYSELGIQPHAGRLLVESDENLATRTPQMVAVLGYGIWQREFGGNTSIIGQTVKIEGIPFTIVGIGPRGFTAFGITSEPDVTVPLTAAPRLMPGPTVDRFANLKSRWVSVVGRLKPGVTMAQADAQLQGQWIGIREATLAPDLNAKDRDRAMATALHLTSAARGKDYFLRGRFTTPLYAILSVAGLMLLIACVNLASLLVSRAAARSGELSVRLALGAGRWRIARQMITEGLLLSIMAAALGVVFAGWTSQAIATMMTRDYLVPSVMDVRPDLRVLTFAAMCAIAAGVLFSVVPALRVGRGDPALALRQGARTLATTGRTGKILIVAQVALSLVLLMDAGLLVRTLQGLRSINFGFTSTNLMVAGLFPRPDGYANIDIDQYYPQLAGRLASVAGVDAVGFSKMRIGTTDANKPFASPVGSENTTPVDLGRVGPGFFSVLKVPIEQGREFQWTDNSKSRRVAIVSRSIATRLFGGDALGRHIRVGDDPKRADLEIVGITPDARLFEPRTPQVSSVFVPMLQDGAAAAEWGEVIVRGGPGGVALADLRDAIQSMGRESIMTYRTLQRVADRAILQEMIAGWIGGFFGALALLLAAVGLYGLMAYAIAQRQKEIGIRMALGAQRAEVVTMVMRETMVLVGVGLLIGVPAALGAGRFVSSLLVGLTPTDPVTLGSIAVLLLAIGLLAGYVPGRRASRTDPGEVLRQ